MGKKNKEKGSKGKQKEKEEDMELDPEKAQKKDKKAKQKEKEEDTELDAEKTKKKEKKTKQKGKDEDMEPEKVKKKEKKDKQKDLDEDVDPEKKEKTVSSGSGDSKKDSKKKAKTKTLENVSIQDLQDENESPQEVQESNESEGAPNNALAEDVANKNTGEAKENEDLETSNTPVKEKFIAPVYESLIKEIPMECITLESMFDCLIQQTVSDVNERDFLESGAKVYRGLVALKSISCAAEDRKPKLSIPKFVKSKDYATSRVCHLQENLAVRLSATEIRGNLLGIQNFLWKSIDEKHTRGMHLKSLANLYQFMQFIPTIKPDDLYYIIHSLLVEGISTHLQKLGTESIMNVPQITPTPSKQTASSAVIQKPRNVEELESFMVIPKGLAEIKEYIPGTQLLASNNYYAIDRKTNNKYFFVPEQNGKLIVTTLGVLNRNSYDREREFSGYDADIETAISAHTFQTYLRNQEIPGEVGTTGSIDLQNEHQSILSLRQGEARQTIEMEITPAQDPTSTLSEVLIDPSTGSNGDNPTPPNTAREREKECVREAFNPFILQQESFERFVPCDNWDNNGVNDPRIMGNLLDCSVLSTIHHDNGKLDLSTWAQKYLLCNGLCAPVDRNIVGPISELSCVEELSSHQMIQVLGEYIKNYLSFHRFYNPFYDTLIFIFNNPNPSTLTAEESFMTNVNLSPELQNFLEAAIADDTLQELLLELEDKGDNNEGEGTIDLITLMRIVPEDNWKEIPSIQRFVEQVDREDLNKLLDTENSKENRVEDEGNENETSKLDVQENGIGDEKEQLVPVSAPTKDEKQKRKKSGDKTKVPKEKKVKEKGKKKAQFKEKDKKAQNIETDDKTPESDAASSSHKKKKKVKGPKSLSKRKMSISKRTSKSKRRIITPTQLKFQYYNLGKRMLTHASDLFYIFPENGPIVTYEIEAIDPDYLMLQLKLSFQKNSCIFYPYYVPADMDLSTESYVVVPYFHFTLKNGAILSFSDLRVIDKSPRRELISLMKCEDEITNLPTEFGTFTLDQIIFITDKWKDKCQAKKKPYGWKKLSMVAGLFTKLSKLRMGARNKKSKEEDEYLEEMELMEEMLGELESENIYDMENEEEDEEEEIGGDEHQAKDENEGEIEDPIPLETEEVSKKLKKGKKIKDDENLTKKEKSKDKKSKKGKEKDADQDETKEKKEKKKDKKGKSMEDITEKEKDNKKQKESSKAKKQKAKPNKEKDLKTLESNKTKKSKLEPINDALIKTDEDEGEFEEWDQEELLKLGITQAAPSTPIIGYTFSWKDAEKLMEPLVHSVSVTLPSGLNIKIEDDLGPPVMRLIRQAHQLTDSSIVTNESARYYLSNGTVISFLKNKSLQIINPRGAKTIIKQLFANLVRDEANNPTIYQLLAELSTNLKMYQGEVVLANGERYKFIRGKRYLTQPMPIYSSCPIPSGEIFRRRQDGAVFSYLASGTVIIHYPDGTRFTSKVLLQKDDQKIDDEFHDWIFVGLNYLIEHPNYSTVQFNTLLGDTTIQFTEDSFLEVFSDGLMQVFSSSDNFKININSYVAMVTCPSTVPDDSSSTFAAIKLFHSPELLVLKDDPPVEENIEEVAKIEAPEMSNSLPAAQLMGLSPSQVEVEEKTSSKKVNKKKAKKKNAPKPKKISAKKTKLNAEESQTMVMDQDLRKDPGIQEDLLEKYSAFSERRQSLTIDGEVHQDLTNANAEIQNETQTAQSMEPSPKKESLKKYLSFTDMWTFCKISDTVDNRFAMDIYGQIVVDKTSESKNLQIKDGEDTKVVVVKRDLSGFEFLRKSYVNKLVTNHRNSIDDTTLTIDPLSQGRRLITLMEPFLNCPNAVLPYKEQIIRPEILTNKHMKLTSNHTDLNWFGYMLIDLDKKDPSMKEQEKIGTFTGRCQEKYIVPDSWKNFREKPSSIGAGDGLVNTMNMEEKAAGPVKSEAQSFYEAATSDLKNNPVHPEFHKEMEKRIDTILTRKIIEIPKLDDSLTQLLSTASESYSKVVENYKNIYLNYEVLDPRSNQEKESARLVKQRFFEQNLESMHLFEQESGKAMLQFHF